MHAAGFIDRLPKGLASEVGERGASLSVGQKQLLSFARALAFDPRVLVLDEATSSVDTDTELLIRDALKVLMTGRTTIAIAHRLSTIQDMDRILVFHKGELRESGAHQELLAQRGIYYRLYQLQVQGAGERGVAASSAHRVDARSSLRGSRRPRALRRGRCAMAAEPPSRRADSRRLLARELRQVGGRLRAGAGGLGGAGLG